MTGYTKEPYIDKNDNLVIPFSCNEKHKWWKYDKPLDVESLVITLIRLGRPDLIGKYVFKPSEG
ncbi:MAG: hypothetical protein A2287_04750 [Candidatus Melainabacteria bacterium RIFOXYA12_FULL_32_12]|nr:MAG: hypothetical protein A2287_04750 [Candidatus Melainabacteria bacterium RIFOXYA12_FULL_32_12]